jgi:hypothetical protein
MQRDSVVHAQFNAAYAARAHRWQSMRSYQKPGIGDPAVVALTARTVAVSDPAIEPAAIEPARVSLKLAGGSIIEMGRDTIKGSPEEPLSGEEIAAKFRSCLEFGLDAPAGAADRLAEVIRGLERSPDAARDIVTAFPQESG